MAKEGKQFSFTIKNIAMAGIGIFFTSWAIPKTLDYFLDTTFLTTMKGWLLGVWSWLLQEEPLPHWFLLAAITVFLFLIAAVNRLNTKVFAAETKDAFVEAVDELFSRPKTRKLSKLQHRMLMTMGEQADAGITFMPDTLARECKLTTLEFEVGFQQLIMAGMVEWSPVSRGYKQSPRLTQKGKEYILQARSDVEALL